MVELVRLPINAAVGHFSFSSYLAVERTILGLDFLYHLPHVRSSDTI